MYLVCSSPLTMILSKDDAFMILTTKIGLPTVDIITDCLTVENVFSIATEFAHDSQLASTLFGIGYAMIFFLVLSFYTVRYNFFPPYIVSLPSYVIQGIIQESIGYPYPQVKTK